jgi:tetratricopeptide (TPR) repeat protein
MAPLPSRALPLAIAFAISGLGTGRAWAGPEPESGSEKAPESEEETRARAEARAEGKKGSAAFREGDYAKALKHFGAASALRPSPKLHYNIAVCHHRLSISAGDEATQNYHKDQAIEAYNRYLEAVPEAEDRIDVAETVRELGGTPATYRGLKSAFGPKDEVVEEEDELEIPEETPELETPEHKQPEGPAEHPPEEGDDSPPEPPPQEPLKPTELYHLRAHFGPHIGVVPQQFNNADVAGAGALYVEFRAGGFLGKKKRHLLGFQLGGWAGSGEASQLSLASGHGAATYDYDFHLGKKHRWILDIGVSAGGGRQAIRTTATAPPPRCSARDSDGNLREQGRLVSARWGGVFEARFNVGVLIGERRWHEVNFSVHPQLGVYGQGIAGQPEIPEDGSDPSPCRGSEQFPFQHFGVASTQLGVWGGFGYAFRF